MPYTISIVGCGWLGLPLAVFLGESGHKIKGSTTKTEKIPILRAQGISPYLLKLSGSENFNLDETSQSEIFQCDILIINIPPKVSSTNEAYHPLQIQALIANIRHYKIPKVIYISAISVYPKTNAAIDEETKVDLSNTGNKALFNAEQLVLNEDTVEKNILRCGGLLGYDRIPGKYYRGKVLSNGHTPVNYIHRDDAIGLINQLIRKNIWNKTYNLVAPSHPTRQEVFTKNARDFGFEPPEFISPVEKEAYKLVLGDKVIRELQYEFLYPNPLLFHYTP